MRALFVALACLAPLGCAEIRVPVVYVPAAEAISPADGASRAVQAVEELGYEKLEFDPSRGMFRSAWRVERGFLGPRRHRVMMRVREEQPFAVAISVPLQSYESGTWSTRGEAEDRRKQVVAHVRARLQYP